MVYLIVKDFFLNERFINGGSNYARNLVSSLKALGSEFTLINWSSGDTTTPKVNTGTIDSMPYLEIVGWRPPLGWYDAGAVEVIRRIVGDLPRTPTVFHLVETDFHLGSWIKVLKEFNP